LQKIYGLVREERNYKAPENRVMGSWRWTWETVWRLKLNTLASQSLFWSLRKFFGFRRSIISISILNKCWYFFFFEIGNGMVIIYNNSDVVGSDTLCDGLYMIHLMHFLSHFSHSASFVNIVVVSKCSENIETSSHAL
jgi:hypothetical protein